MIHVLFYFIHELGKMKRIHELGKIKRISRVKLGECIRVKLGESICLGTC